MTRWAERAERWASLVPAFIYYAAIFWLSSRSHLPAGPAFPLSDKLIHAVVFAGFGAVLRLGFGRVWPGRPETAFWASAAFGTLGAVLDEYHQLFVPLRNADVWDAAADTLGIMAALWVIARLTRRKRRPVAKGPAAGTP